MNLLKILNTPNFSHKRVIEIHTELILNKCQVIARNEYREQQANKETHDGMCPLCKSREGIINRFALVQGKGSTTGNIKFGFGTITGAFNIDTQEVNHCKSCGNEWLKYKTKPISKTDILRVAFKYLKEIIEKPDEKKREYKKEAIMVFDGCCAEALYKLNVWKATDIKLSVLRKYYTSVYDTGSEKLEKL